MNTRQRRAAVKLTGKVADHIVATWENSTPPGKLMAGVDGATYKSELVAGGTLLILETSRGQKVAINVIPLSEQDRLDPDSYVPRHGERK